MKSSKSNHPGRPFRKGQHSKFSPHLHSARNHEEQHDRPVEGVLAPARIAERMVELLKEPFEFRGYEIVRIQASGRHRLHIQIMIDRVDCDSVKVDDCVEASNCAKHWLAIANFIAQDYTLEVSSPGSDRPLITADHFKRFVGSVVTIKTRFNVEERKRFTGLLSSATDDSITLMIDGVAIELNYNQIDQARIVP